jgi:hypothetical protein
MGFGSLQHIKDRRSTHRGLKPCPLRSAFRVWLPSWRLTPAEPVPVLFHTGGAHGIRPSELSPLRRYPPRFRGGRTHIPFHPSVIPAPKRWAGPTGRGSWAVALPRVPGGQAGFSSPTTGCSLGLRPLRVCQRQPCPGFHPDSTHALCGLDLGDRTHRRPGVSIGLRLALSAAPGEPDAMDKTTLPGSLHQHDPAHSSKPEPGLCVHLIPRRALLPTGR